MLENLKSEKELYNKLKVPFLAIIIYSKYETF